MSCLGFANNLVCGIYVPGFSASSQTAKNLSTHELYGSRGNINDLLEITFWKHLFRANISVTILSQQKIAKWSRRYYTLIFSFIQWQRAR
jgi:hypothetical protein